MSLAAIVAVYWLGWSAASLLFDIVPALAVVTSATVLLLLQKFRAEQRRRRMHDARTGLPNRFAFQAEAGEAILFSVAATIGGYERLEAVLGNDLADQLILRITERLQMGNAGKTVYRAEDRALAWTFEGESGELESTLAGLAALMRSPVEVGGRKIDVQMAFGVGQGRALSEAIHAASQALRRGERWLYHAAAEEAALERQVSLMGELDAAIEKNELDVPLPAQAGTGGKPDNERRGARPLGSSRARLSSAGPVHSAGRGKRPDHRSDALCAAQGRSTITAIGAAQGGLEIRSAVNISARLVTSASFLSAAEEMLKQSNIPPQSLIFEVTESAAIADSTLAAAALTRFRDMGVAISMDDYGTGQSSLTYLKKLPLSELKIDRSFVQFAHRDAGDAMLVRSTVSLGHELGLSIVAEGVEDEECLAFLREVGCDYAQGYLIGKPMPAGELEALVNDDLKRAA